MLTYFLCEFVYSSARLERELNMCVLSEMSSLHTHRHSLTHTHAAGARAHTHADARTNLLDASSLSRLECLHWQSLNEFILNTDGNVCSSGLAWARALSTHG